jgi:hypothetical protein
MPHSPGEVAVTVAQNWALIALIGVFATAVVTLMTFLYTSLRNEMTARFETVDARFNSMDVRFNAMDTRFDHLDRALAVIDRVFRRDAG